MYKTGDLINWKNTAHIAKLLNGPALKIVILSHLNPDGDTLGSSLGLLTLFNKIGHQCHIISPNDYPEFLKWMPGNEHIIILRQEHKKSLQIMREAEVIFAVDFNELKRVKDLKEVFETSKAYKVLIDHHPDPAIQADCMLSDITVSSAAELVYRFIVETGHRSQLDKDIATCLYTGIMTDTGCFSYNSSNRATWEAVADLLDCGIDKDKIFSLIYDNYSHNRMRLLGYSLNEKMEVLPEYRTGYIALSKNDLLKYHFEVGDSEGFVNYPLSIKGISFSALFVEKDDQVKISFRSKGNFPVNNFAKKHFHGGGHKKASGGESFTDLTEAVRHFRELLPVYKDKLCKDED